MAAFILSSPLRRVGLAALIVATASTCAWLGIRCGWAPPTPDGAALPRPAAAAPPPYSDESQLGRYPWISDLRASSDELTPLASAVAPPEGFEREPVAADSWQHWLRHLPTYRFDQRVHLHTGEARPCALPAVIALDVGERNLQQCADSILRLHAEWAWSTDRADELGYHFTSGHQSDWADWAEGERFRVQGSRVERVRTGRRDRSHAGFRSWLSHLFRYAGTRSLPRDTAAVAAAEPIRAGDVFVQPGGPGHAVIVLDVAVDAAGQRVALIGQGFMPAQQFHVVGPASAPPADRRLGPWIRVPTGSVATGAVATSTAASLHTSGWRPFTLEHRRRFAELPTGDDS